MSGFNDLCVNCGWSGHLADVCVARRAACRVCGAGAGHRSEYHDRVFRQREGQSTMMSMFFNYANPNNAEANAGRQSFGGQGGVGMQTRPSALALQNRQTAAVVKSHGRSQQQGRLHNSRGPKKPEKPHGQGTSGFAFGRREKAAKIAAAAQTAQQQQQQQQMQQMAQMAQQVQQMQQQMQQQQQQHEQAIAQMRSTVDAVGEENANLALQHAQAHGNMGMVTDMDEAAPEGDQVMGDRDEANFDIRSDQLEYF